MVFADAEYAGKRKQARKGCSWSSWIGWCRGWVWWPWCESH